MPQEDDRVRVNGRVPRELYAEISTYYANITAAINDALELLRQEKTGQLHKDCGKNMQNDTSSIQAQLDAANMQIDFLKEQLKVKDTQQEARINDLLDQLKVKDQQLEKKDNHIENLTNTMQSQAINIHDMLNQKAIEAPREKKKPFWKFW